MKKIFALVLAVLLIFAVGCQITPPTESGLEDEPVITVSDTAGITKIEVTEQPFVFTDLKETDEWVLKNQHQSLFPYNGGYYFYVYPEGGNDEAGLWYLNSEGKLIKQPTPRCFCPELLKDDALYGIVFESRLDEDGISISEEGEKYRYGQMHKFELNESGTGESCLIYNGGEIYSSGVSHIYYTQDYIYFIKAFPYPNNYINNPDVWRMDYNGKNITKVASLKNANPIDISDFIVYLGKIWYTYSQQNTDGSLTGGYLTSYDMETGEMLEFDRGGLGICTNNGYFYYYEHEYDGADGQLYRFNCETYCVEKIFDVGPEYLMGFTDDYLLYTKYSEEDEDGLRTCELHRFNGEEDTCIFVVDKLFECDWMSVEYLDNRIIVAHERDCDIYVYLIEIDIDGKIIKKIYEGC